MSNTGYLYEDVKCEMDGKILFVEMYKIPDCIIKL